MRLDTRRSLRLEIEACGYFPDLVEDSIALALAEEELVDFVVHHEPTFNRDEIHRHVTVLALTPTRLLVGHTDDHHGDPPGTGTSAAASTESILLSKVDNVVVTRVVPEPERYAKGTTTADEAWLTVSWGTMRRLDLEPAGCEDPECEADHGFTGSLVGDDLTMRISAAIDGAERVAHLIRFGSTLQRVAGTAR